MSIPSPFNEDNYIDLYITLDKNTQNSVEVDTISSPYVRSNISLSARILSASENVDYFDDDNLELIETYAASYVKSEIENYFYKTSKEFKSDISMLGKYAVSSFYTLESWEDYNWLENYTNAFFNVNVDVNVVSSYLIS